MAAPAAGGSGPSPEGERRRSPLRVGLTGGLASGKSTVARLLGEAGLLVVDADRLVADLYRPGGAGAAAVAEIFGPGALDASGAVDRAAVAGRVFADDTARRRLEEAIHPLVRRRFAEIAGAAEEPVVVLEATLLVEAGYGPDFDLVVAVEAEPEVRLARAIARGLSEDDARARLAAQGDGARRRAGAGRVIDNSGDLAALEAQVAALAAELRERAAAPADLPPFVLVTCNRDKAAEAERILGRPVQTAAVDLPEIQSLDLLEVLRAKGEEAWRRLGRPLVVEETGLALDALGGFPGPLVRWMLEATGPEGIARAAIALGDPAAHARCALLYRDAAGAVVAEGADHGELVLPARGDAGFGWDVVFQPAGEAATYAELGAEYKDRHGHRGRAWRALVLRLTARTRSA